MVCQYYILGLTLSSASLVRIFMFTCKIQTSDDSLSVKAGDEVRDVTLDNMLKRQEDAKRAAMTAANKNPRRR